MEISCRLNAAMSASGNHRYGNEGTNGTGAHPHNFTHSHMASDAPQPQITGPRKHPEAETHPRLNTFLLPEALHCQKVLRVTGVRRGTSVSCI